MKRLWLLGVVLIGLSAVGLMIGCSDDDDDNNPVVGDPNDASFQYVDSTLGEDLFEGYEGSWLISEALLEMVMGVVPISEKAGPLGTFAAQEDDEIVITAIHTWAFTEDRWFVFTFEAKIIETGGYDPDTVFIEGVDSAQLLNGGVAIDTSEIAGGFDGVKARAHVSWQDPSEFVSAKAHHRMEFNVAVVGNDSLVTLDGTVRDTMQSNFMGDNAECDLEVTNHGNIDGFAVLIDQTGEGCPQDGSISVTATIDLSCVGTGSDQYDQLDVNGTWTITAVINDNNTVTISYTDGTTVWTVTEDLDCGGSA